MIHEIDHHAQVTLMWLEEGQEPTADMFNACGIDHSYIPELWPDFDQAFRNAMHTHRLDKRQPWMKTDRGIFSPIELRAMYIPLPDEDF